MIVTQACGGAAAWRAKIFCSVLELLLAAPILVILPIYAEEGTGLAYLYAWLAKLAAVYGIGLLGGVLTFGWRRYASFAVMAPAAGLLLWLFVRGGGWGQGIVTCLSGAYSLWRGRQMARPEAEERFASGYGWKALLVYLPVSLFYFIVPALSAYLPLIRIFGFPAVLAALWLLNRTQVATAALSNGPEDAPKPVRRWNGFLAAVWILLIVAVAAIDTISAWVKQLMTIIVRLAVMIVAFFLSLFPDIGAAGQDKPEGAPPLLPAETGHPSAFAVWLERILYAIVYAGLAVVLIVLAVWAVRWLGRLLKKWLSWWTGNDAWADGKEEPGYTDEAESLRAFETFRFGVLERWKTWAADKLKREPKWKDLQDNRQRVRYLFRQALLGAIGRGYAYRGKETAAEAAEAIVKFSGDQQDRERIGKLLPLYRKARYGSEPIDDRAVSGVIDPQSKETGD